MTIEEYIQLFDDTSQWFEQEMNKPHHIKRIADVVNNREYLKGHHQILNKEDGIYKGEAFVTRKTVLQYIKTLLTFHDTLLLGKPVSIVSEDEETAKTITDIYKYGLYDSTDYTIIDRVNKFGDAYEYIYVEDNTIKSKVLDSADCYPVYSDTGEYLAFIEHWTDVWSNVSYTTIYYPDIVEYWNDEGGDEHRTDVVRNISGLPIHYHNINDEDEMFGLSILNDLKPIMDDIEDIMSKLGDAIYTNSLNPMPVALGQRIESTIPADATGYVLNLDNGDYKVVSTTMDYQTIKVYLDNIKAMLNDIACFPSVLSGNTNVANVSSVSLQMLFHMALCKCYENEKWLNAGFKKRFEIFKKILGMQGTEISGDVSVEYNVSMPVATDEVINNLKTMRDMGAISIDTVMEKSDFIKDIVVEKERLKDEETSKVPENSGDEGDGMNK